MTDIFAVAARALASSPDVISNRPLGSGSKGCPPQTFSTRKYSSIGSLVFFGRHGDSRKRQAILFFQRNKTVEQNIRTSFTE